MKPLKIMGYASLFGVRDLAGDIVQKGAFIQSLMSLPAPSIRMLYQHDSNKPIGEWKNIQEDDFGLWVEGEINSNDETSLMARLQIENRQMDGLSIGFRTLDFTPQNGGRVLKKIDLREISLVGFPMLPRARLKIAPQPTQIAA